MSHLWQAILAIDNDRWACEAYRANFPNVRVECGPVADYIEEMPGADVLLGGPPCPPFSKAGKGKGHKDARNCIPDFIKAIARIRPRQFLMEQVDGLLDRKHLPYAQSVCREMESLGYRVEVRELDAMNYGVPQFRNRSWWWGIRRDVSAEHCWPRFTHVWPAPASGLFGHGYNLMPGVTVRQAGIDGCTLQSHADPPVSINRPAPTIRSGGRGHDGCCLRVGYDYGGCPPVVEYRWSEAMHTKHPPMKLDSPAPTVQAKWFKGGAEGLVEVDTKQNRTRRTIDEPANTIASDSRHHLKTDGRFVRRLTTLECARLQSAPDDFEWPAKISKTNQYRIIGNGWACGMAWHMSQSLAAADPQSRTVIDLFCGGGLGACGWHGRYWSLQGAEMEVA